jgi:hypothetical protein
MIVLHPNERQYNALNSYTNGVNKLIFAIDGSGRYIVGLEVLDDPNFSEIHSQLEELERIEYTPVIEE